MFLDIDTLKVMTKYCRAKNMCNFFKERGYKFDVDRYGYPLVLKSAVEKRLGESIESGIKKINEPDFDALDHFSTKKKK